METPKKAEARSMGKRLQNLFFPALPSASHTAGVIGVMCLVILGGFCLADAKDWPGYPQNGGIPPASLTIYEPAIQIEQVRRTSYGLGAEEYHARFSAPPAFLTTLQADWELGVSEPVPETVWHQSPYWWPRRSDSLQGFQAARFHTEPGRLYDGFSALVLYDKESGKYYVWAKKGTP